MSKTRSKRPVETLIVLGVILTGLLGLVSFIWSNTMDQEVAPNINLPVPRTEGAVSIESTLLKRRSVREFQDGPLSLESVSQLLWSAQGITDPHGYRTAPSAGGLYPLELYIVVGNVQGLNPGIYHYRPKQHRLDLIVNGDFRRELCKASLSQDAIQQAPVVFVIFCVFERTTVKYRDRGVRYVFMEAGHAAQNLCLQAISLGLGSVTIGAFSDNEVARILKTDKGYAPIYIIPVGMAY